MAVPGMPATLDSALHNDWRQWQCHSGNASYWANGLKLMHMLLTVHTYPNATENSKNEFFSAALWVYNYRSKCITDRFALLNGQRESSPEKLFGLWVCCRQLMIDDGHTVWQHTRWNIPAPRDPIVRRRTNKRWLVLVGVIDTTVLDN